MVNTFREANSQVSCGQEFAFDPFGEFPQKFNNLSNEDAIACAQYRYIY